jgi:hypothetical protein
MLSGCPSSRAMGKQNSERMKIANLSLTPRPSLNKRHVEK